MVLKAPPQHGKMGQCGMLFIGFAALLGCIPVSRLLFITMSYMEVS